MTKIQDNSNSEDSGTKTFKLRKLNNNLQDLTDDETQSESEDIKEEVTVTQKTKKDISMSSSISSDSANKVKKIKKVIKK